MCSLCMLSICKFSYFPFGFEGWILVLIASVPGLSILFTLRLRVNKDCLRNKPNSICKGNNDKINALFS